MPKHTKRLFARIDPDGAFAIYEKKVTERRSGVEAVVNRLTYESVPQLQREIPGINGAEARAVFGSRLSNLLPASVDSATGGGEASLDLTDAANSDNEPKVRAPRGFHGMTSLQARQVRNLADYLEWRYGRRNLTFLTLTIPGISEDDLRRLQENWSEICNRVQREIKRELKRHGGDDELVGATEIQTNRLERTGQEVPHLHIVFNGKDANGNWKITPARMRKIWSGICQSYLTAPLCWSSSVDMKPVRKSASRYLSKYLSKGRTNSSSTSSTGEVSSFVSSWVLITLSLRRLFRRSVQVSESAASILLPLHRERSPMMRSTDVWIPLPTGRDLWVGVSGFLSGELRDAFAKDWITSCV